MNEYNKLKQEFEVRVKKLQDNCSHKRLSKWMEVQWAIGHTTGTSTRVCLRCNKRVMNSYSAKICQKCGEKNSWYISSCLKCNSTDLKEYLITEKNGRIIEKEEVNRDKEGAYNQ